MIQRIKKCFSTYKEKRRRKKEVTFENSPQKVELKLIK